MNAIEIANLAYERKFYAQSMSSFYQNRFNYGSK